MRGGPHVGQRGTQSLEACQVVGPQTGQQPESLVVGERVDRSQVEADPLGHHGQAELGQVRQIVPHGALEGDGRAGRPGGAHGAPLGRPVGVAVIVEEQVEACGGTEVEQRQRFVASRTRPRRGRVPAGGWNSGRPRWSGSSGLRSTARALPGARGRSRRSRRQRHPPAGARSGCRARRPPCRRSEANGCSVPARSRKCTAARRSKRASLGERCAVEQRQDVVVVGDGSADGGVGGTAVTFDSGGKGRGNGRPAAPRRARG